MRVAAFALVVAACQSPLDHNGLPFEGGGIIGTGGGGGPTGTDAHAATDGATTAERVCLTNDARMPTACASSGAGGFTVTLGTQSATTNADGTFMLTPPLGLNTWHVTGAAIVPSEQPYTPTYQIPALSDVTFQELESGNGVIQTAGQGSLFVSVVHNGAPLASATATVSPAAQFATFYDDASATTWGTTSTGPLGMAWLAGVTVGTVTLTVTPMGGTAQTVSGVPIGDGANTFLTVEF